MRPSPGEPRAAGHECGRASCGVRRRWNRARSLARSRARRANQNRHGRALVDQTGIPSRGVRRGAPGDQCGDHRDGGVRPSWQVQGSSKCGRCSRIPPWATPRTFLHAFIIRKFDGNVYVRKDTSHYPLHKLWAGYPREFPKEQSKAGFNRTVPNVLATRLEHEPREAIRSIAERRAGERPRPRPRVLPGPVPRATARRPGIAVAESI
jgi:hypothetical protein